MVEALLLLLAAPLFVLLGDWLPRLILAEDARAVALHAGRPQPPLPRLANAARLLSADGNPGRTVLFAAAALLTVFLANGGWRGSLAGLWVLALMTLLRIDLEYRLLPDLLTQPMLWLGLLLQIPETTRTVGLEAAIAGAITGYLPFRLINDVYRMLRGREGMGQGDMKLLAALGAIWGPWFVVGTYVVATFLALIGRGLVALSRSGGLQDPFAFGPAIVYAALLIAAASSPALNHGHAIALG